MTALRLVIHVEESCFIGQLSGEGDP
jgi:hypothetical protein